MLPPRLAMRTLRTRTVDKSRPLTCHIRQVKGRELHVVLVKCQPQAQKWAYDLLNRPTTHPNQVRYVSLLLNVSIWAEYASISVRLLQDLENLRISYITAMNVSQ